MGLSMANDVERLSSLSRNLMGSRFFGDLLFSIEYLVESMSDWRVETDEMLVLLVPFVVCCWRDEMNMRNEVDLLPGDEVTGVLLRT